MGKKAIIVLISIVIAILFLYYPSVSVSAAKDGIEICTTAIIPSLFPFFILTNLWYNIGVMQKLSDVFGRLTSIAFHLPPAASAPLIFGTLSGFPVGAQTAIRLYEDGKLSKSETEQTLMFCSNAGPAFVIGFIGNTVFQNQSIGFVLWTIHLLGAAIIGIVFRPKVHPHKKVEISDKEYSLKILPSLTQAISKAGTSIFAVCIFIISFTILIRHLQNVVPLQFRNSLMFTILYGIIELSSGSVMLTTIDPHVAFVAISGLLAWSGLCVHCQVLSSTDTGSLRFVKYFCGKSLHAALSVALACLIAPSLSYEPSYKAMFGHILQLLPILIATAFITIILKTTTGKVRRNRI